MRPVSTAKTLRIRSRCESTALVQQKRYAFARTAAKTSRQAPIATYSRGPSLEAARIATGSGPLDLRVVHAMTFGGWTRRPRQQGRS